MISEDIPGKDKKGIGGDRDAEDLWLAVTKDVKPLRGKAAASVPLPVPAVPAPRKSVPALQPLPLAPAPGHREVDRRTAQKLKRGRYPVDVTVDLHGMTQAAAHKHLRAVLLGAHARRQRCVLVITGKGKNSDGAGGIIKRSVPEWLQEDPLRAVVLRAEAATPAHGGGGALYVLLRRQRTATDDDY